MERDLVVGQLRAAGMAAEDADALAARILPLWARAEDGPVVWRRMADDVLTPDLPFAVHRLLFETTYAAWDSADGPAPAWVPTRAEIARTHIARLMAERGFARYEELHRWSVEDRPAFWATIIRDLGLRFRRPYDHVLADARGAHSPVWLPGARLNIIESCFAAGDDAIAIVHQRGDSTGRVTYGELRRLAWRVANGLWSAGVMMGDGVAIAMPMTVEAVAAYLGVIAAGGVVVSIADSFAPHEIATRLAITRPRLAITQDRVIRGGRELPMYAKLEAAGGPPAIVVPAAGALSVPLRPGDRAWSDFLAASESFEPVDRDPAAHINILFSSGTTGEPKAVPWNQTTPIKCAADARLHHDVGPGDVVAWPTNLGWMMGPWLIFATLINRAAMALFYDAPTGRGFCEFVDRAGVTMLGVVPSLVKGWRAADHTRCVDWSCIRRFSSTGECSSEDDMLWLMSRAGYRPVIEYCGGTEIGGGYICGSMVQPAAPATFSTPALGLALEIRDDEGRPADNGEVYLVPPSIGLSTELLNRNHDEIYYADTPAAMGGGVLRRHGDQIERLGGGYYRGHGRVDDTMNLGGIKVSSIELERALMEVSWVVEAAAIAVSPPGGGPSELVVFVVPGSGAPADPETMLPALQSAIRQSLNPLFKIHDVVVTELLPRTATQKVMRRRLRDLYGEQ